MQPGLLLPQGRLPVVHHGLLEAGPEKPEPAGPDAIDIPALPDPELAPLLGGRFRAHLVGIGGTGVVTANQILAYAAMIDGYEVESLDQSGMAQKGGAVISSTVISDPTAPDASNKVGLGQADVLFAFDTVGTASPLNLDRMSSGRDRRDRRYGPSPDL